MGTIEIKDEEIKVEEIMEQIRESIRKMKETEVCPEGNLLNLSNRMDDNRFYLQYLQDYIDISNNNYFITSHRSFAGKFLVKGRSLVNGEVRRYVDPIIYKQTEFNNGIAKILSDENNRINQIYNYIEDIEHISGICKRLSGTDDVIGTLNNRLNANESAFDENKDRISKLETKYEGISDLIKEEVSNQIGEILLSLDSDFKNRKWLINLLEKSIDSGSGIKSCISSDSLKGPDLNYFIFEEKFRGSREDIKSRQKVFLPFFEGCKNVLDVGCGRGEFLEIMRKEGIGAKGVDLDETMIEFCRSKDLDVIFNDALIYLETLEDSSLDGIFIDQVVEHLEPADLVRLLELCYKKLKLGYYIIAETINPLSFTSFVNFYIDLTHVRPVHPETLKYLFDVAGFREIETFFSSPVSDENKLKIIEKESDSDEVYVDVIQNYNNNIQILNMMLFGAQDYAVLGKK